MHTTGRGKGFTDTLARPIGERKTAFASSKAPSLPVSPLPIVVSGDGTLVRVCHLRFLRVKFEDLKVALNY